jgi:hypothetical protein
MTQPSLALCALIAAAFAPTLAHAAGAPATNGKRYLRKGAVVCRERGDAARVAGAKNSLRHFSQLRALIAQGRCVSYASRTPLLEMGTPLRVGTIDLVEVRSEDRPLEWRWTLNVDIGPHAR